MQIWTKGAVERQNQIKELADKRIQMQCTDWRISCIIEMIRGLSPVYMMLLEECKRHTWDYDLCQSLIDDFFSLSTTLDHTTRKSLLKKIMQQLKVLSINCDDQFCTLLKIIRAKLIGLYFDLDFEVKTLENDKATN